MMNYVSLFSSVILFLFAQAAGAQTFGAGAIIGGNVSQIDGDFLSGYNRIGLNTGIFVYTPVSSQSRVQLEFTFTMKGAQRRIDENNIGNTGQFDKFTLNYVEVPVMYHHDFNINKVKLTGLGGLSMAYLISAHRTDFTGKKEVTDGLKRTDACLNLGLEYKLTKNWAVNGRFQYSLYDVDKSNLGNILVNPKRRAGYYNNVLSLTLRYYVRGDL